MTDRKFRTEEDLVLVSDFVSKLPVLDNKMGGTFFEFTPEKWSEIIGEDFTKLPRVPRVDEKLIFRTYTVDPDRNLDSVSFFMLIIYGVELLKRQIISQKTFWRVIKKLKMSDFGLKI